MTDLTARQRSHLVAVSGWASKARESLTPLLQQHGECVHFRPAARGVAMVGLLESRPQRGKSGLRDLQKVVRDFESLFATHCRDVSQGRPTAEKALQSYLIRDAYRNGRQLACLNAASALTDAPADLMFVTDEIVLPIEGGQLVCDVLACRRDVDRLVPVLMELKNDRMMKRMVAQVDSYAALIDTHLESFSELYSAVLGQRVALSGPCEKWIVWPFAGGETDPREDGLLARGIRVVRYREVDGGYAFSVGACPEKAKRRRAHTSEHFPCRVT